MTKRRVTWFELRFPRDLNQAAALAAFSAFAGLPHRARLVLELSATQDAISHHLGISVLDVESVAGSLRAAAPSLRLIANDPASPVGPPLLWQVSPYIGALHVDDLPAVSANLLGGLFPLNESESIQLRWHIRSAPTPAPNISGDNELRDGRLRALRAKLVLPGMAVYGELFVSASSPARRQQLRQRVASVLRSMATPYGRLVGEPAWYGKLSRLLFLRGRYLSAPELAAVAGWPIDGPDLPGLRLGTAKRLVPMSELPERGRILGVSDFPGLTRPVALSAKASTTSLHLLGPTGTGKSSLLRNLIRDDLEEGRGLLLIETNGDLIQDAIDAVPQRRLSDVVLLDATDTDYAVGFNPFAGDGDPSLVADQLGELFERLWSAFWGPRTAQLTHMGLLTLAKHGGGVTLLDLPQLYLNRSFRARVLSALDDPIGLGPDWEWFEALPEREQLNVVSPLLNKARQWAARPALRAIVGQPQPRSTMRQIIEERKVLLCHLPKGLIGNETAQLLGCLVLTSAWQALAERAALPAELRTPFAVHVDEAQDFAAAPVPWDELLAQGRKYGLALTIAHQNLAQLPKELREVVLANARSKVAFALGSADAKALERDFAPALTAADLQALDPYAVAALVALEQGGVATPVTLDTPPPPPSLGTAKQVRALSRRQYARPRPEIEAALRRRLQATQAKGPIGRKPRSRK